jgi:DNA-binding YbaB/EbfC family protein
MKDMSAILRQAQAMQAKIAAAQTKLETLELEGSSGGGMVKVRLTGKGILKGLEIDPSLMVPEEREILEDLIKAAHEDARRKHETAQTEEFKAATGGMAGVPGFKFPV